MPSHWQRLATRFRWVSITPLGSPWSRSSTGARRCRSPDRSRTAGGASPAWSSSLNGRAPAASPKTKTSSTPLLRRRLPGLVEERRHRDEEARAAVRELLGQLVGGVERVGGGGDPAERGDGEHDHAVLGQVRAVDREHVALPEPARGEPRRHAADAARELAVGQRASGGPVDQRGLVAEPRRVPEHVLGDRDVGMVTSGLVEFMRAPSLGGRDDPEVGRDYPPARAGQARGAVRPGLPRSLRLTLEVQRHVPRGRMFTPWPDISSPAHRQLGLMRPLGLAKEKTSPRTVPWMSFRSPRRTSTPVTFGPAAPLLRDQLRLHGPSLRGGRRGRLPRQTPFTSTVTSVPAIQSPFCAQPEPASTSTQASSACPASTTCAGRDASGAGGARCGQDEGEEQEGEAHARAKGAGSKRHARILEAGGP